MANPSTHEAQASAGDPVPAGFNHLSIPVKDVKQSLRFFMEVLGAERILAHRSSRSNGAPRPRGVPFER